MTEEGSARLGKLSRPVKAARSGDLDVIWGPVRTCVGCRRRGGRSELLRIVATPQGSAQVDPARDRPGRGAWIHADAQCVDKARTRGAVVRALRLPRDVGESVWEDLAGLVATSEVRMHLNTSDGSGLEADGHPMSTQR